MRTRSQLRVQVGTVCHMVFSPMCVTWSSAPCDQPQTNEPNVLAFGQPPTRKLAAVPCAGLQDTVLDRQRISNDRCLCGQREKMITIQESTNGPTKCP